MVLAFQKKVLDELVTINIKLNNVMDQVGILVNSIRLLTDKTSEGITKISNPETVNVMQLLPIKTEEDLKALETFLCNSELQEFLVGVILN